MFIIIVIVIVVIISTGSLPSRCTNHHSLLSHQRFFTRRFPGSRPGRVRRPSAPRGRLVLYRVGGRHRDVPFATAAPVARSSAATEVTITEEEGVVVARIDGGRGYDGSVKVAVVVVIDDVVEVFLSGDIDPLQL